MKKSHPKRSDAVLSQLAGVTAPAQRQSVTAAQQLDEAKARLKLARKTVKHAKKAAKAAGKALAKAQPRAGQQPAKPQPKRVKPTPHLSTRQPAAVEAPVAA